MEGLPEVTIQCQGATLVKLEELHELHHFKITSDVDYAECRNSLTELGFSFPFFIWIDDNDKKWTVDGSRRLYTLTRMKSEGIPLPATFPADLIFAKDKKEAAKKVIASESRYGDIDSDHFKEFLGDNNLALEELEAFMDIPDFDIPDFEDEENNEPEPSPKEKKEKTATCPRCKTTFKIES
jgi:hypothetical protein